MKPVSGKRFVLEGALGGYCAEQSHVAHREVISAKRAAGLVCTAIRFTDGTLLTLSTRPAEPREKVAEKHGYTSLIRDAESTGLAFVTVDSLVAAQKEQKAAREAKRAEAAL